MHKSKQRKVETTGSAVLRWEVAGRDQLPYVQEHRTRHPGSHKGVKQGVLEEERGLSR